MIAALGMGHEGRLSERLRRLGRAEQALLALLSDLVDTGCGGRSETSPEEIGGGEERPGGEHRRPAAEAIPAQRPGSAGPA